MRWAPLGAKNVGREVRCVPGFVVITRAEAVRIRRASATAELLCSECVAMRRHGGYRWFARARAPKSVTPWR